MTDASSDPFGTVLGLFDISSMAASFMPELAGAGLKSLNERLYHNAYLQARFRPSRTPLLMRALTVTAVSTIEPLVTRMIQLLQYRSNPGAYTSLADPALDKKTRELCYGPPDKWRRALVDVFGISAAEQVIDWDRLGSLWNDRNIHVHRGSVVDSRGAATRGTDVGTVLNLEAKDVQAVIDEIGAARFAVVAAVWDYIAPGTGAQLSETGVPFTESMRAGRWRQAEGVARVEQSFARSPEALADARVGRWLARELGLGANAVRDEVLSWDITGLPDQYRLAQLDLLHRDDEALTVLRELLANGSIGRDDLDTWPLFDRLRDEGMLGDLVAAPRARGQHDSAQP